MTSVNHPLVPRFGCFRTRLQRLQCPKLNRAHDTADAYTQILSAQHGAHAGAWASDRLALPHGSVTMSHFATKEFDRVGNDNAAS